MTKLPHFAEDGWCYFLTSTTCNRKPIFMDDKYAQILCNIMYNLRRKDKMFLLGFVIMPEHLHLLIVPAKSVKIAWIMQEIKKGSARLINKDRHSRAQGRARLPDAESCRNRYSESSLTLNKVWMDEYYDYVIRNEADLMKHLNYIFYNPVKRGLVESAEEYVWSSAHPTFENDLEKLMSGSGTNTITRHKIEQ
jgi:REP-associated tyrosine transposase